MATTPTKLGPYEILSPLGSGGMGEVYRARDSRLNREVAVKILRGDVADDPSRRARFEREAQTVAGLNHPNIVALFEVGNEAGVEYTVSELVDGEPLRSLIQPDGVRDPCRSAASSTSPLNLPTDSPLPTLPESSTVTSSRKTSWSPATAA